MRGGSFNFCITWTMLELGFRIWKGIRNTTKGFVQAHGFGRIQYLSFFCQTQLAEDEWGKVIKFCFENITQRKNIGSIWFIRVAALVVSERSVYPWVPAFFLLRHGQASFGTPNFLRSNPLKLCATSPKFSAASLRWSFETFATDPLASEAPLDLDLGLTLGARWI